MISKSIWLIWWWCIESNLCHCHRYIYMWSSNGLSNLFFVFHSFTFVCEPLWQLEYLVLDFQSINFIAGLEQSECVLPSFLDKLINTYFNFSPPFLMEYLCCYFYILEDNFCRWDSASLTDIRQTPLSGRDRHSWGGLFSSVRSETSRCRSTPWLQ